MKVIYVYRYLYAYICVYIYIIIYIYYFFYSFLFNMFKNWTVILKPELVTSFLENPETFWQTLASSYIMFIHQIKITFEGINIILKQSARS